MSLQQHLGLNVAGMYHEKNFVMTYVDRLRRRMRLWPEIDAEDELVFYRGLHLAQTMRSKWRLTLGCGIEGKRWRREKASFLLRIAPRPINALNIAAYSGHWYMQIQGPKTIGHMNTYISVLDFTSVPAWIILYCLTAGGCFSCLSCKFFCKWCSPLGFFRIQAWIFRCSCTRPPLRGKVCWLGFFYMVHSMV